MVWYFDRLRPMARLKIVSLPCSLCTGRQSAGVGGNGIVSSMMDRGGKGVNLLQ